MTFVATSNRLTVNSAFVAISNTNVDLSYFAKTKNNQRFTILVNKKPLILKRYWMIIVKHNGDYEKTN